MEKTLIFINEQHSLLREQEEILNSRFENLEFIKIPAKGWNLEEQKKIAKVLSKMQIVFCSPIPFLLAEIAKEKGFMRACSMVDPNYSGDICHSLFLFHNDKREKKELPNGKIISVVAQTGWQLIEIE